MFAKLSQHEEYLAKQIVDIAFKIHRSLGPELLESVYSKCFCYELFSRKINYKIQKEVPIVYESIIIDGGLRLDLLVDDLIIVEFKAQEKLSSCLGSSDSQLFKINVQKIRLSIKFSCPLMKDGIKRIILWRGVLVS